MPVDKNKQLEVYIGRLAEDFSFFGEELWQEIGLPPFAEHQKQIGHWLQDGPRRRGVRAFRGASKTWVTLAYCLWRLFVNPNERILLVSKSEKNSKDSLFMIRRWISQVPWLQHLSPDRRGGQRDSAVMFDVGPAENDRTPSFAAASVTGQITGRRASIILGDDCETSENTLTIEMRDRLREQVKEFENILIPGGDIIMLGTPHHKESLYDKLVDGGYVFRCWPCRLPTADELTDDLAPELAQRLAEGEAVGSPVWPERFTTDELTEREASEGRSTFMMQYMMLTHLGGGVQYPLQLKDLIVFPVAREEAPLTITWGQTNDRGGTTRCEEIPSLGFGTDGLYSPIMYSKDWGKYTGSKMWIDPAGRGADKTAYAIVSHLNGNLFVKDVGGLDGGYSPDVLEHLVVLAKKHMVREIFVESNFGMDMFVSLIEPVIMKHLVRRGDTEDLPDGWGASIEGVHTSGQKEVRIIQSLEPVMNQHRLIMHPDVAMNQELQRQMVTITRDRNCLRHEDEVEALAMCVKQWTDVLNQDQSVSAERQRERKTEERLRAHYVELGLEPAGSPRWFKH